MTDFLKMDIFFAVTTTIVLLLGVFALVALIYLIRILRSADHIAKNVSAESDNVREDIQTLRARVRDEGMKWRHFLDFFNGVAARSKSRKKKTHDVG